MLEPAPTMHTLKILVTALTIAGTFFFAFWEMKLRRGLTDAEVEQQHEMMSDYSDPFYGIRKEFRRERALKSLPSESRFKLRVVASIKVALAAILVLEVLFFT